MRWMREFGSGSRGRRNERKGRGREDEVYPTALVRKRNVSKPRKP
jgi:hypothetical protein